MPSQSNVNVQAHGYRTLYARQRGADAAAENYACVFCCVSCCAVVLWVVVHTSLPKCNSVLVPMSAHLIKDVMKGSIGVARNCN